MLSLIDPSLTVGDLGCGTGQVSELIAPHVARVIAVDGSTDMVQAARKRLKGLHQVEVRRGDMEALPIDDGSSMSRSSRWCCITCRSRRARWPKCIAC